MADRDSSFCLSKERGKSSTDYIEKRGVIVNCVGHNKINIRIFGVSRQDTIFNTKPMYFSPLFYWVISQAKSKSYALKLKKWERHLFKIAAIA